MDWFDLNAWTNVGSNLKSDVGVMVCDQCRQDKITLEAFIGLEDGEFHQDRSKVFCSKQCFQEFLSKRARFNLDYRCGFCLRLKTMADFHGEWKFCRNNVLQVVTACCEACFPQYDQKWFATLRSNDQVDINCSMEYVDVTTCRVCAKPSSRKCSACKLARYCSVECQRKDWSQHKPKCTYKQELADMSEAIRRLSKIPGMEKIKFQLPT